MKRVQLDSSARLRATSRDPNYITKDEDLPRGIVELGDYPRIGDDISWPETGRTHRVVTVAWMVGEEVSIVVLD